MVAIDVYGIRHHGPGSARALLAALEAQVPDVLAIEMPADLQHSVARVGEAELQPPVALVAYEPTQVEHALYYPLASFSPEWVAMRWAAARGIPIHAIDLPATLMIGLGRAQRDEAEVRGDEANGTEASEAETVEGVSANHGDGAVESLQQVTSAEVQRIRLDPLGELARLAGYDDRERWWEVTFELHSAGAAVFPAVTRMIAALRAAYPQATDAECQLRERHMARSLLVLAKAGVQRIAVVCGAWHAPALAPTAGKDPLAALKKLSSGYARAKGALKGPKLTTTWIPWTYERLRTGAGYGAGVRSPVWYELLYEDSARATEHYLTLVARELRDLGAASSTAQIVDAVDLAESLRRLRGLELAGLHEIQAAAEATLTQGEHVLLDKALVRVESNRTTGRVPADLSALPLQKDLEARLKELRLLKSYRDMEAVERELDLRKPAHLATSQLLCQLLLLDIPFGQRRETNVRAQGTFRESWRLHWLPDYALRLIVAHRYGHQITEAARAALHERLEAEVDLVALSLAVDLVIAAGLFEELDDVAELIRAQAAEASDVWLVARALPELLRLARYPSLRVREAATLDSLHRALVPKLAAGLAAAVRDVDEAAAREGFTLLRRLQPYVGMLDEDLQGLWLAALRQVSYQAQSHPLFAGFALRTLADAGSVAPTTQQRLVRQRLSPAVGPAGGADFLEGFLYSSAQVLLYEPEILQLLHAWVADVELSAFRDLLPALRRTFAQFSRSERRKLAAVVANLKLAEAKGEASLPKEVLAEAEEQITREIGRDDTLSQNLAHEGRAVTPTSDWDELSAWVAGVLGVG